jgi:hypothetical protein
VFQLSVFSSPRITDLSLRVLLLSGSYVAVCKHGQCSTSVSNLFLDEGSHTGWLLWAVPWAARGKITIIGIHLSAY